MSVCALSGGQMEAQYMQVVQRYATGQKGKRGCDSISHAFGTLVDAMERTRKDILGDMFQGGITYGEAGQFLTSEAVCELMARMTIDEAGVPAGERKRVADPCCGSDRMLLAAAKLQPNWEFIGQDVDLRCVRMTAINLALRNTYGYVIWGNSLGIEKKLVYRTGFNLTGFVREIPVGSARRPFSRSRANRPAPRPRWHLAMAILLAPPLAITNCPCLGSNSECSDGRSCFGQRYRGRCDRPPLAATSPLSSRWRRTGP